MPWRSLGDIVQAWRPFPVTDDPGDRDSLSVSLGLSAVAINGLADQHYLFGLLSVDVRRTTRRITVPTLAVHLLARLAIRRRRLVV
jgi:hypothetical protein